MTDKPGEDHRTLGTLRVVDGRGVVRIEDRFGVSVDNVWDALIDPGRLAAWLGQIEGDLRVGGAFSARFHASGWEGTGRVEVCEPQRRVRVTTKGADDPHESSIEIALTADGGGTVVVWEEDGKPLDLLAAYGAGIQIHLEDLVAHLAGRERHDPKARFAELFPAYQQMPVAGA